MMVDDASILSTYKNEESRGALSSMHAFKGRNAMLIKTNSTSLNTTTNVKNSVKSERSGLKLLKTKDVRLNSELKLELKS